MESRGLKSENFWLLMQSQQSQLGPTWYITRAPGHQRLPRILKRVSVRHGMGKTERIFSPINTQQLHR